MQVGRSNDRLYSLNFNSSDRMITEQAMKIYGINGQDEERQSTQGNNKRRSPEKATLILILRTMKFNKQKTLGRGNCSGYKN